MIAIIKYNAGNIFSVKNALSRLNCECVVTNDKEIILKADKVIFPGVGEASSAMDYLNKNGLDQIILQLTKPILGICLGLQLMCESSEEGDTKCLGIFKTPVKKFPPKELVPHMGWNNFENINGPLFDKIDKSQNVYFVHSYYAAINDQTIAQCNYIQPFSAAMQQDNFYATQFHPEKSAGVGAQILKNFINL